MASRHVVFSHGLESGPWGTKISAMAEVAKSEGWNVDSVDYRGVNDPRDRVTRLLSFCRDIRGDLVLVGSSLGGYVATSASALLHARGLFLMAPAFYMSGTEQLTAKPAPCPKTIVHGWHDHVVPVENSTEGAVNMTLDRLIESDVFICGEAYLEIGQQLLSRAANLSDVKRVLSHPQGLAQCRAWLAQHLPDVPTEETPSTAAAVEMAAADPTLAGIASVLAGELYGVPILRERIEDNRHNATRFLVIGRQPIGPSGHDKTSILFAMRNEPGALYRILEPIVKNGLNLTKIESRPAKSRAWEYVIFVDVEGHRDTAGVAAALREIEERTIYLKILGSYPAG